MQEGQTIKHDVYGLGIVTASDQERTSVDFDDHGPKLFVTSMMTAELIGEAPATPPKTKRRRKASTAAKAAKAAKKAAELPPHRFFIALFNACARPVQAFFNCWRSIRDSPATSVH